MNRNKTPGLVSGPAGAAVPALACAESRGTHIPCVLHPPRRLRSRL